VICSDWVQRAMATLEYGADRRDIKPLVKAYSKRQLKCILEDFTRIDFEIAHFKREHILG